ncbi:hypothetical protein [Deferribacter abyssi]|uniref:hypothetical protein n=1 Tax=Deferribacter abyssi TaxID=213806 RepID=UPI003C223263
MTEERFSRIEKKMDELVRSHVAMQQEIKMMAKTLETLADVSERLARFEEQILELKKDVDIAFNRLREMDETGVRVCGAHLERTKKLESDMKDLKNRLWAVWITIFAAALGFISWVLRQ